MTAFVASSSSFCPIVLKSSLGCSSPDLDEQLFFHASEVLQPEGHEGAPIPFKDAITAGDEVEFLVGQNTGKRSNFVAKQVRSAPIFTSKNRHSYNAGVWDAFKMHSKPYINSLPRGQSQQK